MAYDGSEGEQISLTEGAAMTAEYRSQYPNEVKAHYIGKNIINSIFAQSGCVGIRIYQAVDTTSGDRQLVIVGVKSTGADMTGGIIADRAIPCNPNCDTASTLNG